MFLGDEGIGDGFVFFRSVGFWEVIVLRLLGGVVSSVFMCFLIYFWDERVFMEIGSLLGRFVFVIVFFEFIKYFEGFLIIFGF